MKRPNIENSIAVGSSLLTVVAPKFCCWSSAIAAISGGTSYLAWVHPMRPYLVAIALLSLGYSHYKAHKINLRNCAICNHQKAGFFQSKIYLWLVTIVVIGLFAIGYLRQ